MTAYKRNEFLHLGRGLAALGVVFYHANIFSPTNSVFEFGRLGVQFFFFLSGFLMVHTHMGRTFSLRVFISARATRIYPIYLPIGIFAALMYVAIGRDFSWLSTLTLLPGRAALVTAWTLQREIFFYAIFAFAMWSRRPSAVLSLWAVTIVTYGSTNANLGSCGGVAFDAQNLFFIIGAVIRQAGFVPHWQRVNSLAILGDSSYSIYLVHLPLMGGLWRLDAGFTCMVLASISAGICHYYLVEKPVLNLIKRRLGRTPSKRPANRFPRIASRLYPQRSAHHSNG